MRAKDFVTEIERLDKSDYEGGKDELSYLRTPNKKKIMPLPGGSGFQYSVITSATNNPTVVIIDPNASGKPEMERWDFRDEYERRVAKWEKSGSKPAPKIVAKLSLYYYKEPPFKNALKVGSITVDEDYRGRGLAKALYGIVLSIMKKTLVAGGEQTPGGRRNWLSIASIPGVEVKGFVQIDKDALEFDPKEWPDLPVYNYARKSAEKGVDRAHDNLMRMGGQYLGKNNWSEYWAFDVIPNKKELKQAVKTSMNTLYDDGDSATGMFAVWTGK